MVYVWVLIGTGITFGATALGAALVFFVRNYTEKLQKLFLGFASGIMVAAAVWSLIIPSIEMAEENGSSIPFLPALIGFVLGGLFLFALDKLIPHQHVNEDSPEGIKSNLRRTTMLVTSVTLHNIPEGMAVGLTFALAYTGGASVTLAGAFALAFGMALQNLPEGAAISLPLRQEGFSKTKAFFFGALSGIVEPIGGILIVLVSGALVPALPYLLSFAAGAMIYVVVEELIPQSNSNGHSNIGVLSFMAGFALMMVLDVAFG